MTTMHLWVVQTARVTFLLLLYLQMNTYATDDRNINVNDKYLVLSRPHVGAGLMNQLSVLSKALVIGNMIGRHVAVEAFNIHYSGNITVPIDEIIDISATNNALKVILQGVTLSTMAAPPDICFYSTSQLDRRCGESGGSAVHFEVTGAIDSTIRGHASFGQVKFLGLSSWLVYVWPGIELKMSQVMASLCFRDIYYQAAEAILHQSLAGNPFPFADNPTVEAGEVTQIHSHLCGAGSQSKYGVLHLRFEKDFIDYLHGKRGDELSRHAEIEELLLSRFITKANKFLSPHMTVFVCASEGELIDKGVGKLEALFKRVIMGPKVGLFSLVTNVSSGKTMITLTGQSKEEIHELPTLSTISTTTKAALNARELYALVDLIIAVRSTRFIGVSGSSFSKCVSQLRRQCNNNASALWNPMHNGKK